MRAVDEHRRVAVDGQLERSADWDAWMAETKELTTGFLTKYDRLLELGSPHAVAVLQETLEHERAVHKYAEQRLLGHRDQAARGIVDHLQKWRVSSKA
ncbi:hypothetical protein ACVBEQ_17265 [Nakamurella sp. GG22]